MAHSPPYVLLPLTPAGFGALLAESERGGFVMLERVDASYTVSHRLIQ